MNSKYKYNVHKSTDVRAKNIKKRVTGLEINIIDLGIFYLIKCCF